MTVNDLLKRLKEEDYDKVMVFSDGKGWANIDSVLVGGSTISLVVEKEPLFSES